jgi:hypothetical protein
MNSRKLHHNYEKQTHFRVGAVVVSVIPATQEEEMGASSLEDGPKQKVRRCSPQQTSQAW